MAEVTKKAERTVTVVVNPKTFWELEVLARKEKTSLTKLYYKAVKNYLCDHTPARLTVFAAPASGKRIRVAFDQVLFDELSFKILDGGFSAHDVIYTALEDYLGRIPNNIAA